MTTVKPIVFEKTFELPAPPERVFRALTDAGELSRWFAEHADVGDQAGAPYKFWGRHTAHTLSERQADQAITAYEPNSSLAFDWTWGGVPTRVAISLSPSGDGTTVTVHHEADGAIGGHNLSEVNFVMLDFWCLSMGNLKHYITSGAPALLPDHSPGQGDVVCSIEIDAPRSIVWKLLTDPSELDRWIGQGAKIDLRVGGEYSYGWADQAEMQECECVGPRTILELDPERRLVHDWDYKGGSTHRTEWTLDPLGADRTRLTVRQIGAASETEFSGYTNGWGKFLLEVREIAEHDRRA